MLKKLISLFVAAVMLVSVFSLSVAAEENSLSRSLNQSIYWDDYYWVLGHLINVGVHADDSYAYAFGHCKERDLDSTQPTYGITACAYVNNIADEKQWMDADLDYVSVDVTHGELQHANDYPMDRSYAYTLLGSYEMERVDYYRPY